MKQIRCSVSREELDAALKFSGLCITGEGSNMSIARVPEWVREHELKHKEAFEAWNRSERLRLATSHVTNEMYEADLSDVHIPRKHTLTPEQQLIEAEAKLSQLENKIYALEGDIAWLVDAMRRIGEQIKRGGV